MSIDSLPERIRSMVESDLRPVQPVAGVASRAAVVVIVAALFAGAGLAALGIRSDIGELPTWLGWGSAVAGLVLGVGLTSLALRESIPGQAVSAGLAWGLVLAAAVLHLAVGIATWKAGLGVSLPGVGTEIGLSCMSSEVVLAVPAFVVTLWLALRAMPIRARLAGLLGATGSVIIADGVNHLHCPLSDLGHVIVWHGGAIVLFAILGWTCGWVVESRRNRS